jgi:hypothetical protein
MENNIRDLSEQEIAALVRKEKAAYQKKWSAANRDRVKLIQKRYWQKKALKALEQQKEGE